MPRLMHTVEDGIITGNIERNRGQCSCCDQYTMVINIQKIDLPQGIEPSSRLIPFVAWIQTGKEVIATTTVNFIGIGCGCYAKAHRQLAHIQSRIDAKTDLDNVLD